LVEKESEEKQMLLFVLLIFIMAMILIILPMKEIPNRFKIPLIMVLFIFAALIRYYMRRIG